MRNCKPISYDDAAGKTVEAVRHCIGSNQIVIYFTDDSVLVLHAEQESYEDSPSIHTGNWNNISDWEKVNHGVMTEAESKDRAEANDARCRQEQHDREVAEYRRMQRKFKDLPPDPPKKCNCGVCQSHGDGACRTLLQPD